jgi:hypothetical protein
MSLLDRKSSILTTLRCDRASSLQNDARVWRFIEAALLEIRPPNNRKSDQKRWADESVRRLGLIYTNYTGALPGFTNSEHETRFESFARAVMASDGRPISRNLLKAAIRRLDAKSNREFLDAIDILRAKIAAE